MRPNEDMQLKKKNRKSGTPSKVREQDGQAGKVSVWGCSVPQSCRPLITQSLFEYTAFCETFEIFSVTWSYERVTESIVKKKKIILPM